MNIAKAISHFTAAVSLIASIIVGREWLLTGGGDMPSLVIWSVLLFSIGFSFASELYDRSIERMMDEKLSERITAATEADIDALLGDGK